MKRWLHTNFTTEITTTSSSKQASEHRRRLFGRRRRAVSRESRLVHPLAHRRCRARGAETVAVTRPWGPFFRERDGDDGAWLLQGLWPVASANGGPCANSRKFITAARGIRGSDTRGPWAGRVNHPLPVEGSFLSFFFFFQNEWRSVNINKLYSKEKEKK